MENPATWRPAELVVMDAYEDWAAMNSMGAIGPSLPLLICERLRDAGHLTDADEPGIGWRVLKDHRAQRATLRRERSGRGPSSPVQGAHRSQT
jgi:hypothetical protein